MPIRAITIARASIAYTRPSIVSTLAVASATYSSVVKMSGGANCAVASSTAARAVSMPTPSATAIATRLSTVCTWWASHVWRGTISSWSVVDGS